MDDIKPTKIVKPVTSDSPSDSAQIDSAASRSGWDSRLNPDQTLVEQFKHYPLIRFFGLDEDEKADDNINEKIKAVYKWSFAKHHQDDPNVIMKTIRFLEMEMGLPPLGTSRLDHVHGLIEIENKMTDLENERRFRFGY